MPNSPGNVWDLANSATQCMIAVHGICKARDIITEMQSRIDGAVRDQQKRHPEDWKDELKQTPAPTQSAQTEPNTAKNTTKIPQIPRVGG
jgi:hypothetical protein